MVRCRRSCPISSSTSWIRSWGRRGHRFVRYADDCNVFVGSARAGARIMAAIAKFLASRMRLQVNAEKSAVLHPSKVHFLGLRFLLRQDGLIGVLPSAKTETTAGDDHQGDDVPELGPIHHLLHGRLEPLPDRMEGALPAMLAVKGLEFSTLTSATGSGRA